MQSLQLKIRQFFNPATVRDDITAGLVLGIESVPDGLAKGFLASVNPVYGLYAYMVGTFSAAFFTSSVYMAVQATSAMSLIVASVPQTQIGPHTAESLFGLAILTGVIMLTTGLLKLGTLLRFVPNSVMVGFVNATAVLIILGQLNNLTGYRAVGANKIVQAFDLFSNLDKVNLPTLFVGLATIFLIPTLEKTRLKSMGLVVAMVVASLLVPLFGWDSVAQLQDIADVPRSLPLPVLPPLAVLPPLIVPAFSLAFVGLVQGASISKSYANPDGKYPNASGDFVGQGIANLAAGLFQGMPVGGSFSASALVVNGGARSRFANIFAGIVMAVVIVVFGRFVGGLAMPALAGLLIVVGFSTLKLDQMQMAWKTTLESRVVMLITFVACLVMPLQYAVLVGVALSIVLFVVQRSNQITVKEWKWTPGELMIEQDAPEVVPAGQITLLVPYGSLFFATAPLIEEQLPEVTEESRRAVVILNLLKNEELGSTFLQVLDRYAAELRSRESKLMLASVSTAVKSQLDRTGLMSRIGRENVFVATDRIGEAVIESWYAADRWLGGQGPSHDPYLPTQE